MSVGVLRKQPLQEGDEVHLGAGGAYLSEHRPAGDAQGGDEDAGAAADVLGLAALDARWSRQAGWRLALRGSNAGLLVERDGLDAGLGTLRRQAIRVVASTVRWNAPHPADERYRAPVSPLRQPERSAPARPPAGGNCAGAPTIRAARARARSPTWARRPALAWA